jgi:hypothetical protein
MADIPVNVIGHHVSRLPAAIEDVWPVIDESGIVTEVVRTWDDAQFVRLDRKGNPVDQIAHTHHLMPRRVFQVTELPVEWEIVGARRITRDASQIENRLATGGATIGTFGDRQEYETLVKLNACGASVVGEIDTCPPFGHIVEMDGVFYQVEFRPGHEPKCAQDAPSAAEESPVSVAAVEAVAVVVDSTAAEPAAAEPAKEKSAANALAEWIAEVAAQEAAAVAARPPQAVDGKPSMTAEVGDLTSARPEPPKPSPDRAAMLKAVVDPLDEDFEPPAHKSARASGAELAALLDKRGPGSSSLAGSVDERVADASMLVDERRVGDEHETVRAQSFARAAAFITSASSGTWDAPEMAAGMLTVEQVRKAGRFAWDEFMNLYLPHVGFVAAVLKAAPSANGAPGDVSFVRRSEQDVRPVGWHHLIDCGCAHCESRGAAS